MPWKFESDRPIYTQILEHMMHEIITGSYAPGSKLPSVRDLAAQAGVNPNTMQRAMAELESKGFIISNRTMGKTVTEDTQVMEETKHNMASQLTNEYVVKMNKLGYNIEQIISIIKEEE